MKLICILLTLTTAFSKSFSQDSLPPVFEIHSDTALWTSIPHTHWQILEDKEGKLTINDITKESVLKRFHDSLPKIDQSAKVYWVRYRLKNTMDRPAYISIDGYWDFRDTYIRNPGGQWGHLKSGTRREMDERNGLKYANIFPDTLQPNEEKVIYQRSESDKPGLSPYFVVGFNGTNNSIKTFYIDYVESATNYFDKQTIQEAFLVGLLLLAMFINLFFYKIVKEKVYLYFSLFSLLLAINRLYNILLLYTFWEKPLLTADVKWLTYAWAFIPFFLIQFSRHFLNMHVYFARWGKLLAGLGILNIILFGTHFFLKNTDWNSDYLDSFDFELFPFLIIPVCICVTLLLFITKKVRSVRIFIIAAFPYLLLFIITQIRIYFFNKSFPTNFRTLEVATVSWLVILFTITLLLRFEQLRKQNADRQLENEKLAREKEVEKKELIAKQKTELEVQVSERTADLKHSLEELKATQSQLIQSEKMASLGELTAGIAHEIQNPLNFVNNFSEVSNELIDEMKAELETGNSKLATVIANDIKQNLEKINHHGKRADAIVKGMLQHSRSGSGHKELTDINALADEYLRLSYHGLRAKDKSFNAEIKTDFDKTLPAVNIVPQDIGRAVLNLFTNAFYSVNQKKNLNLPGYQPTVSVSTKKTGTKVEIRVRDNGMGIPQKIADKIFQPFFTTKPTGQGTGLGLSLTYDIITKAHSGEIKVETKEGEGAEFIILLPL